MKSRSALLVLTVLAGFSWNIGAVELLEEADIGAHLFQDHGEARLPLASEQIVPLSKAGAKETNSRTRSRSKEKNIFQAPASSKAGAQVKHTVEIMIGEGMDNKRGRGRKKRSAFSAGGSFALGAANRGGSDEEEGELGEELSQDFGLTCPDGLCKITEQDVKNLYFHGYNKGEQSKAEIPAVNCAGDQSRDPSIYVSEWLVKDPAMGCFASTVEDAKQMGKIWGKGTSYSVTPYLNRTNSLFWNGVCNALRRQVSNAVYNNGCNPEKTQPSIKQSSYNLDATERRSDDVQGRMILLSHSTDCGVYHNSYPDCADESCKQCCPGGVPSALFYPPDGYFFLRKLDIKLAPVPWPKQLERLDEGYDGYEGTFKKLLKAVDSKVAGKCISRKHWITGGGVNWSPIPGMCQDGAGECQCTDGRMRTTQGLKNFEEQFAVFSNMIYYMQQMAKWFCFDAPTFPLVDKKMGEGEELGDEGSGEPPPKPKVSGEPIKEKVRWQKFKGLRPRSKTNSLRKQKGLGEEFGVIKGHLGKGFSFVREKVLKRFVPKELQKLVMGILKIPLSKSPLKKLWELLNLFKKQLLIFLRKRIGAVIRNFLHSHSITDFDDFITEFESNRLTFASIAMVAGRSRSYRAWTRKKNGLFAVAGNLLLTLIKKAIFPKRTKLHILGYAKAVLNRACSASAAVAPDTFNSTYEHTATVFAVTNLIRANKSATAGFGRVQENNDNYDDEMTEIYIIKAKPKFWRRAASGISENMIDPKTGKEQINPDFKCWPGSTMYPINRKNRGNRVHAYLPTKARTSYNWDSEGNPTKATTSEQREVRWGCPDAVPVGDQGSLVWVASGNGEDMVSHKSETPFEKGDLICSQNETFQNATNRTHIPCKDMGLVCAHKISYDMKICDTCCCKEGLISSDIVSDLIYGNKKNCGQIFTSGDLLFRTMVAYLRFYGSIGEISPMCASKEVVDVSIKELCERFKCLPRTRDSPDAPNRASSPNAQVAATDLAKSGVQLPAKVLDRLCDCTRYKIRQAPGSMAGKGLSGSSRM